MGWSKILLSKDEVRLGELHKIIKLFYDILEAYKGIRPTNYIVILEKIEDEFHHVFFSPASLKIPALTDLINIYSGVPSNVPFRNSINYLAGDLDYARLFL